MARLSSRIDALLAQLGGELGPVQFWVLSGDGFARCGDQVIPEREFLEQHGPQGAFTLRLGDSELTENV